MKIYVGNLPWSTTDSDLEQLFAGFGPVTSASVVTDRDTGRSRGFGFVEMSQADGQKAIAELNGHTIESRALRVNEANSQPRRQGGGGVVVAAAAAAGKRASRGRWPPDRTRPSSEGRIVFQPSLDGDGSGRLWASRPFAPGPLPHGSRAGTAVTECRSRSPSDHEGPPLPFGPESRRSDNVHAKQRLIRGVRQLPDWYDQCLAGN